MYTNEGRGPWGGDAQLGASNSQSFTMAGGPKDHMQGMELLAEFRQDQFLIAQ